MSVKNLVIVESPMKAKILTKFLGKEFVVKSSYGHIRDLPSKKSDLSPAKRALPYASLAIDTENDFAPLYVSTSRQRKYLSEIKKNFDKNTTLYIATDEDREGEAIGWHLLELLKPQKTNKVHRIVFHEITKGAILHAIDNPRQLDNNLVFSQQGRRILDRLVGYKLSPLLWKKIRFGLSAGRVQSVAVRLIVDREREIQAFNPEEYWSIVADFEKDKNPFEASFLRLDGKKFVPSSEAEASAISDAVKGKKFEITRVEEKDTKRNPAAPFTTSTLQQEASRKLGFSVKKTMMVAQKLYEGAGTGAGLITYMRTDSVSLAENALAEAKDMIGKKFGKEYALDEPRKYKKKQKGAQEAHEAIRPVSMFALPDSLELKPDEIKLYTLIWNRTVASQMQEARLKNTSVDLEVSRNLLQKPQNHPNSDSFSANNHQDSSKDDHGISANSPLDISQKNNLQSEQLGASQKVQKYLFRATGQRIVFDGFLRLYSEGREVVGENILPELKKGESLKSKKIKNTQHFTRPPARYTEASLVKKMEDEGIGRPSTYAPTISTVQARGYVVKDGRQLAPTDTAFVVIDLLAKHFPDIVDAQFTAKMENDLDIIADGKKNHIKFLHEFYNPFEKLIAVKDKEIKKSDVVNEKTDEICEKCGKPMEIKLSRYGKFLSCTAFPECKNAKPLHVDPEAEKEFEILNKEFENEKCEKCGEKMVVKRGRFGTFLACSAYPKCKNTKAILKTIGVKCPDCKDGEIVEKRTKRGKIFWGCEHYPDCKFASWEKPKGEGEGEEE